MTVIHQSVLEWTCEEYPGSFSTISLMQTLWHYDYSTTYAYFCAISQTQRRPSNTSHSSKPRSRKNKTTSKSWKWNCFFTQHDSFLHIVFTIRIFLWHYYSQKQNYHHLLHDDPKICIQHCTTTWWYEWTFEHAAASDCPRTTKTRKYMGNILIRNGSVVCTKKIGAFPEEHCSSVIWTILARKHQCGWAKT